MQPTMSDTPDTGGFEAVPSTQIANVLAANREGRCVACYGSIDERCPSEHGCYCCSCDDTDGCGVTSE